MATKTSEAILRVTAKNLASKDLQGVASDLDKITESQKKNSNASDLAAKSARELVDEQKALAAIAAELNRRGGIAGNLLKSRDDIAATAKKVGELRRELSELQGLKASGNFVGNIDKAIKNVEGSLRKANNQLQTQTGRFQQVEASAAKIGITSNSAAEAIAKINVEAARTAELMSQAAGAVERYDAAVLESKAALTAQEAVQREITAEAQRRNAIEAAAAAQRRQEATALQAQLREQARIREQLTKAFLAKPAGPAASPVLGPAGNLAAQGAAREAAFRERLVNVLRRQKDAGDKILANDGKLAAATRKSTAALEANSRSLDRNNKLGGIFADTGRKSLSVYQRMRGQLLSVAAAYVGLYQAVNLVNSAITVQQERRRIEIQLKVANKGDTAAALRDQQFLRDQADRLGLVYEDIAKNFANYKIAAQAVGASNKTIKASFVQATEVVTGLGLSADDAEGVFRAFVQILGKARVQAEELRGQLGDRLPGAVAKFAEANKIPLSQLDSYLKKGKGNVQDFLNFLQAYAETTKGAVQEQSQTLFANFNRLKNAYRDFLETFAKSGANSGLSKVVDELTRKLKGAEGAKFAQELGLAFTQVAKAMIFVVEHFDQLITLVKLFLGLQAAKAIVGLGSSFLNSSFQIFKAGKAFIAFSAATNAARIAGTELTLGMRGMMLLLGPVGIALGVAAAAFYAIERAEAAADAQLQNFIGNLQRARVATGEQLAAAIDANKRNAAETKKQIEETQAALDKATNRRDTIIGGAAFDKLDRANDILHGTETSVTTLAEKLALLKTQYEGYTTSVGNATRRQIQELKATAAAAAADAAQQDNFTPTNASGSDKSAEAAAAKAAALAERRKDIEDRANKAILDMDNALAEARVQTEISSQDQIDANLKASLDSIKAEMDKKRIELEGLKRDAENLKDPAAAASAQTAIDKIPALQKELEVKAQIAAVNASIDLQEKNINTLVAERDAKIDLINTKVQLGLKTEVEGRQEAIAVQNQYSQAINDGVAKLIAQLEALKASDPDLAKALHVDELIAKLEVTSAKTNELQTNMQLIGKNLGGQFSQGVSSFFGTFIKGATGGIEGVNGIGAAFQNAKKGFMDFLADFLVGIGQAILQAILLKAIMNAINGTSGGYADAAIGALTGHTGGIVSQGGIGPNNPTKRVSAAYFAGARRFHTGGLPGLKKDEVPAVLLKGEEVLSRTDPRNALNGGMMKPMGGATEPRVDVAIHNSIDSGSVVEAGLASRPGQKAIFNHIQANKTKYQRMLGIN